MKTNHQKQPGKFRLIAVALTGLVTILSASISSAADGTWTSTAGGTWSTPGNWSGGTVADGVGSSALFNTLDLTTDVTVTLDSGRTNSNLVFSDLDTNTPANWVLAPSAGTSRLSFAGTDPTIIVSNLAPASTVTISCILSNAASTLTVRGNSQLNLTGANTFTNLTIDGAIVAQSVTQSLGANVTNDIITLTNGATLIRSANVTVNQSLNVKGTNTYQHVTGASGNWNGLVMGDGTLQMNLSGLQLTMGGNNSWNSNVWAGFAGTVILSGGGNLRFDANNAATTTFGSRLATFDLGATNNTMNERGAAGVATHTTFMGALKGGPSTVVSLNGTSGTTNTLQVGNANLSTTFSGKINNVNVGTPTGLTKAGTGTFSLNNTNGYSGPTLIQAGALALTPIGAIRSSISITVVSNATFDVSAGQFDGVSATNDWSLTAPQILAGNGVITGSVTTAVGTIAPGAGTNFGVLNFLNNLTLNPGVVGVAKAGSGTNDQIKVAGDLTLNGITLTVTPPSGASVITDGSYPLFSWGGTLTGDANNITLIYSPQPGTITLVTNLVTKRILLQVTGASVKSLVWNGDGSANNWDHSALNWLSGATPSAFTELDSATFNDAGSASPAVNLVDVVTPSALVFNNTNKNYTLTSSGGKITGLTGLTKNGPGTVTLAEDNDYSGTTTINGGTVQVGVGGTAGSLGTGGVVNNGTLIYSRSDIITVASALSGSGTLVQNGTNGTLVLTGNSANGGPILVNAGTLQLGDGTSINGSTTSGITVTSNATLRYFYTGNDVTFANSLNGGGTVLYDLAAGNRTYIIPTTTVNSNFTGTNIINSGVRLHASDNNLGYLLGNGSVVNATAPGSQVWLDRSTTNYNQQFILSGTGWSGDATPLGAMRIFNCTVTGPVTLVGDTRIGGSINGGTISGRISGNFQLEVLGNVNSFVLSLGPVGGANSWGNTLVTSGAIRALNAGGISTNAVSIDLNGELDVFGNTVAVNSLNNGPSGAGVVYNMSTATNGTLVVGADDSSTAFDGTFGDGSSRSLSLTKVGAGTLTLSAASTNTGTVAVKGGTLALVGVGSFGNAAVIAAGSGGIFDVSGIGGTLTLNSGQALKGSGTVNGSVVAGIGSIINPGDGVGALTISGDASVPGTLLMELNVTNAPATNDSLIVTGNLTAGGTLTVTNLGPALQAGNSFQLFSGPVGGFATVNLQTNDIVNNVKYTWNNTLGSNGKISVATVTSLVNQTPTNIVVSVFGTNLTLSWPTDHIGWTLQAQTNSLASGLGTNWTAVVGSATTNQVVIPINTANEAVFFRLTL